MVDKNFFVKKLLEFEANLPQIINDFIKENEQSIVSLNQSQLWDGKTTEDEYIRPLYASRLYGQYKQEITPNSNRPDEVPNLHVTGDFYKSMNIDLREDEFFIKSETLRGSQLKQKYNNILGLTPENIIVLATDLKTILINELQSTFE